MKRRLQSAFFTRDKRVRGEVVYIASESLRDRRRRENRVKVHVRDAAGVQIVILADADNLVAA